MVNIVVTQGMGLSSEQKKRLDSLGKVTYYEDIPKTPEVWLKRCEGQDIILSGKTGMRDKLYELKGVFFSLRFVGVGWIDKEKIKERNIVISNCPGCNKDAVSEWIIAMMLNLFRDLPVLINTEAYNEQDRPGRRIGLTGKTVCILGKGNVGSRVGKICEAFDMNVVYFLKGGNLIEKSKDADITIDCLSQNPTTEGLLNKKFFKSLKKGSYFITVTGSAIYDVDAMIWALDKGILAGAANDSGGINIGDTKDPFYQKLLKRPKILVTPHIAFNTDVTSKIANDMMIDNVEAWLKGKPINLIF
ncbi:MAG: NAD(P)-dependent oxidoreductase [Candidatus Nanoarchaeia archaeon]|nr:NAD(P)-dependent oxidoreductase [Candidatus Nanoarchaeia archaeon]